MRLLSINVVAACVAVTLSSLPAKAGNEQERLSNCFLAKTARQDRVTLVRWNVANILQSPEMRLVADPDCAGIEQVNREMAKVFSRLMLVDCNAEVESAISSDGPDSIEIAMMHLSAVSSAELIQGAQARKARTLFMKYMGEVNISKLRSLFE